LEGNTLLDAVSGAILLRDQCSFELLVLALIVLSGCDLEANLIGLFRSWGAATRGAAACDVVVRPARTLVSFCSIFARSLAAEVVVGRPETSTELFDL
jgi:hypothetical protein